MSQQMNTFSGATNFVKKNISKQFLNKIPLNTEIRQVLDF